jgi:hypothetical protein
VKKGKGGKYLETRYFFPCLSTQQDCIADIDFHFMCCFIQGKGMIEVAEVIHGYNRYKLTPLGISAVNDINESFERCLYNWFNKYNICL